MRSINRLKRGSHFYQLGLRTVLTTRVGKTVKSTLAVSIREEGVANIVANTCWQQCDPGLTY